MSRNAKIILGLIIVIALFSPVLFHTLATNAVGAISTIWNALKSTGIFNGTGG